jgi:hypothetical protein
MVRRLALAMAFALALVGGTTARADAYASRRRVKVVWFDTERVYAAWSAEDGARVGAEATLFRADGTPFGRCRAVWVNDAITAFALPEARWSQVGVYPNTWLELDPEPGPTGHPSGTLTVPIANLPATLDPAHLTALAEKQVGVQIFEGLVRYGPESTPILAAADSATVSGSTWIFHLPASGRFHDGRPLRAADVVASLTRAVSPATHAPRVDALLEAIGGGYLFHDGKTSALQGVTVVDSLRVQIVARDQAMLFDALASPAAWIVPTPAADQPGFAQAPVGSGPFRLAARDSTGLLLVAAAGRTAGPDTLRFRLTHGLEDTELQFARSTFRWTGRSTTWA